MREHLAKIKSKLFIESASMTTEQLAIAMNLCEGAQEHLFPKNVGLLMFSENPGKIFPGAQIDVVEFPQGLGAKEFDEKIFDGPIQKQLTDALSYIKANIIKGRVKKYADRAEADRIFYYPYEAIEEALANAVYHRNYELREPIEVRILPQAIEFISYNGVDPSLKQADFEKGVVRIRRYRNRRIGGFLKELELTEGRGTGIPTIINALNNNGSHAPVFDTDEPNRRYFVTEIKIHPDFVGDDAFPEDRHEELVDGLVDGLVERLVEGLAESQKKIVRLMFKNPSVTIKEMSENVGISTTAIDKNIIVLKNKGIIDRVGSNSAGTWKVNI
jgi:ATP-dependent DNA helicase RecG